jgi:ribosome-associated heat shock protein Hsp15
MYEQIRIDKYLWAVRIFKTRSLATEKCRKGHVLINGIPIKPSRMIKIDDKIDIKAPPIIRSFIVKGLIEKRVSATIAQQNVSEVTDSQELIKLSLAKKNTDQRDKGTGRPTKKDRREIDKFNNDKI